MLRVSIVFIFDKKILELNHFQITDDGDPLGKYNLIYLKNPVWKNLREKLTPFFSSGKLKLIFYIMDKVSTDLIAFVNKSLDDHGKGEFDVREVAAMYTTDGKFVCFIF
jgi:hypothetical protein